MIITTSMKSEGAGLPGVTKPTGERFDVSQAGGEIAQPVVNAEKLSFVGLVGELDLAALQTDEPLRVRVSVNYDGDVSIDAPSDYWLVAEVDIPAKTYVEKTVVDEFGEPVLDKEKNPQTVQERVAIEKINVTLWRLPPA